MKGWIGKILRVDLAAEEISEETLDPKVAKDYIGGRGLGIYILNMEVDPLVDPLSPENKIVMATGPLTGTGAPTGARYMVMTKSPLTGALTCSNSGGQFPTEMKRAGYDAVVFAGRAVEPGETHRCGVTHAVRAGRDENLLGSGDCATGLGGAV